MNLVRMLREKKGWSQEHLAHVSGVGKRTIQRIELGEVNPSAQTAMALAQNLDTEPDAILNWSGLRHHLRSCVAKWRERAPTEDELASLPPRFRPLFAAYHAGARQLREADLAGAQLGEELERIHQQIMALMIEGPDLRTLIDARGDGAKLAELMHKVEANQVARSLANSEHAALAERHRTLCERSIRIGREMTDVALRLDAELDRYDVFAVRVLPSS
jgi:putative transcriptional regulator